jgi:opacity protein-like surface antigen
MTKRVAILAIAIMLIGFSGLEAGKRNYFTFGAGRTLVHKPEIAKKYVNDGYHASLGAGFDFAPWLSMHIVGEYHLGSVKESHGSWLSGDIKAKGAFILMKLSPYTFKSLVAPYGVAGVGYVYADKSTSAGATTIGFGADFWVTSHIGAFFEWRHTKAYFSESLVEAKLLKIGVIYSVNQ